MICFFILCRARKHFKGLDRVNSSIVNRNRFNLAFFQLNSKFALRDNGVSIPKAALISGGGELLSYSNGDDVMINEDLVGHELVGIEVQPDAMAFGTLAADTALTTHCFPVDNDEFDLDRPTEGFASIPEAIEDIRQGKVD